MITFQKQANQRVLELGGGANRQPISDVNIDVRSVPGVDFVVNFEETPWPVSSDEFDAVISVFCLEHISYPKVPAFLAETLRVTKPGGRVVFVIPNTQAQMKYILDKKEWDGDESCMLFGQQDYTDNTHKAAFSPRSAMQLFQKAGFEGVLIRPYGQLETDMVVEATKPASPVQPPPQEVPAPTPTVAPDLAMVVTRERGEKTQTTEQRKALFDRHYFNGGAKVGGYAPFYMDYPAHVVMAQNVLKRKPESVLEVGCLVEGTPIITDHGALPIEHVESRMRVYTHEGVLSPVSRMSFRSYDGEVVCVEPRYSRGMILKLTPDHPVFAVPVHKKFKSWKAEVVGVPEWVPAGELRKDEHWLAFPKPRTSDPVEVDPDYARLCGYYLSQGWCQKKWNGSSTGYLVSFCFNNDHQSFADDVRVLMKRFFGTTDGWVEHCGNAFKICFYSRTGFFQLGGSLGRGARNKIIPVEWVGGASREALSQLVVGMYRGDGNKTGDRFNYSTSSLSMACSLRLAMMRLGFMTELVQQEPREGGVSRDGRVIVGGWSWQVRATGCHGTEACKLVGFPLQKSANGRSYWYGREDERYFYLPIKSLKTEWYNGNVYNMDVEEDHSYSHPTVTVHNCARGYVLKRLEDKGIPCHGLDISAHAVMTRVIDAVQHRDVCETPWDFQGKPHDLFLSIDALDRIPENLLPGVIAEAHRVCKRGLIALDFNGKPTDSDKTRCVFRGVQWWKDLCGPDFEVVPVQELSQGIYPDEVRQGDGRLKIQIGSAFTMFGHGWENIDQIDLSQWAQQMGYKFRHLDARNGLPYSTGVVDRIFSGHFLEHLTLQEGVSFLRECRRVIRADGVMRIVVPDARLLVGGYGDATLKGLDEVNEGSANAPTDAAKLYELLAKHHQCFYDHETVEHVLREAGWVPHRVGFRETVCGDAGKQILVEGQEMSYGLSLFYEATPLLVK